MGFATSEDSNRPGHLSTLIRVFTGRMKKSPESPIESTAKTEVRAQKPRLILVFSGHKT